VQGTPPLSSPGSGYPIGTVTETVPGAPGYPGVATETKAATSIREQTSSPMPEETSTPAGGPGGGKGFASLASISTKYRPYLFGLLGLELTGLILAGILLYRRGMLILPFISKNDSKKDQ